MKITHKILISVTAAAILVGSALLVRAAGLGPSLPTAAVDAGNGDGWTNPTRIENDNTLYAVGSSFSSGFGASGDLKATGYGFSIPAGAAINGVEYTIKRTQEASFPSHAFEDATVSLIKAGIISGNNKAILSNWSLSTTTVVYGSSVDLWGLTLTSTDVNSPTFGADFNGQQSGASNAGGDVYYIKLTVYYTVNLGSARITDKQSRIVIGKSKVLIQ